MNMDDSSKRERLDELLALSATEGLCLPQREKLDALLIEHPEVPPDHFEDTVAVLELNFVMKEPGAKLPSRLLEDLARQGEAFVASLRSNPQPKQTAAAAVTAVSASVSQARAQDPAKTSTPRSSASRSSVSAQQKSDRAMSNSMIVLAASVVLALFLTWMFWPEPNAADPTLAQQFRQLEQTPGTISVKWDQPNLDGEVIWNQERQEGFMRFTGLAVNNPTAEQYQLWIFDGLRNQDYPVDGGVFDISAQEQGADGTIIRIVPKLKVQQPTLFAVTVEKPGGVVVSAREPIVATAAVPTANSP